MNYSIPHSAVRHVFRFLSMLTVRLSKPVGVLFFAVVVALASISSVQAQERTMMQGFYWDSYPGGVWYDSLAYYAPAFSRIGFNGVWFPPPSKGAAGSFDVGYTPYDYYDLGEFDSAPGDVTSGFGNFIPTRYGTRQGLQAAIAAYHQHGMQVYADIVLNHRSGGNLELNPNAKWFTNRNGGSLFSPDGDSTFTAFPLTHGSGRIAWPGGQGGQYFFPNAVRNPDNTGDFFSTGQLAGFHQLYINSFGYDNALHNGDGSNLPLGDSLIVWGEWLIEEIGFDGFRFDFVKGIHPEYFKRFMNTGAMRGKFHVHELYDGDPGRLHTYLNQISGTQKEGAVFDFSLRFTYKAMSDGGDAWDIRTLNSAGLFNRNGVDWQRIVTFVDNHDFDRMDYRGQINQEGHSPVVNNKILAYAHMLTHPGYAQVWWRDYFHYGMRDQINRLVQIRSQFAGGGLRVPTAYTNQSDGNPFRAPFWPGNATEDPKHVYVAERFGAGSGKGLVVAINKHSAFNIDVWVTLADWAGKELYDITGNVSGTTQVFADGRVLLRTLSSSYSVFVPTDYVLEDEINIELTSVDSPGTGYFVGDEIVPRVSITNLSTFSQNNVPVTFEFLFNGDHVQKDTVFVSRIESGDRKAVEFPVFNFAEVGEYEAVARIRYMLDQDSEDDEIRFMITVADTLGAWPYRIDGVLSESQYRTLALKENTNLGFGAGKDVKAIRFADTPDTLYIAVEGVLPLTDGDGIGLFLDFSELQGVEAGNPLGNVPGGSFFLNTGTTAQGNFKMDFEVDYGFALLGVQGGRAALNIADYTKPAPQGTFILPPGESPMGDGTPGQGPAGSTIFPEGSIRYAFSKSGETRHGLEIAIARSALGNVSGGEVRGFAFVISSTAYFSNVLVPGDVTGTGDAFGNIGFNADFTQLAGGPFHSGWLAVNSSEAQPVPAVVELFSPENGREEVSLRPTFSWFSADRAQRYRLEIQEYPESMSRVQKRQGLIAASDLPAPIVIENLTDTTRTLTTNLKAETRYGWRVRAENSSGDGAWSPEWEFTTGVAVPPPTAASTLLLPANGTRDLIQPVDLQWTTVDGSVSYQIQLSRTQLFLSTEQVLVSQTASVQASGLPDNTRIFWRVRGQNDGGFGPWSSVFSFVTARDVSVYQEGIDIPETLTLNQNHPNPFNPSTVIRFGVPAYSETSQGGLDVRLSVFDILGREVAVLVNQTMTPGWHVVSFDASSLSSGVYIYKIRMGNSIAVKKMNLIK